MKVVLSHSGKQHSYHVAKALKNIECLERFFTSSYVTSPLLQDYFVRQENKFWTRRFLHGLDGDDVESNWRFEVKEMIYHKVLGQSEKTANAIYERDVAFDAYMARRLSRLGGQIFWGFQGSCFDSLAAAKKANKIAICELASAHAPTGKRILEEEQKLHPEWLDSIDNVVFPEAYYQRLCKEPHIADVVIGASTFTLNTLREDGIPEEKLRLLPLGFELDHIPFRSHVQTKLLPLKVLYAGRITQRKGIKYLLEATKGYHRSEVDLHLIGHIHGSGAALRNYTHFVHHAPLQQYELFKMYGEFDLFVLPSIFEGFGLVVLEAMAAGLPVITTPHSVGPDIITHGKNGYLVPIRDVKAIQNAIEDFASRSKDERAEMRLSARKRALEYTWDHYTTRLKHLLMSLDGEARGR